MATNGISRRHLLIASGAGGLAMSMGACGAGPASTPSQAPTLAQGAPEFLKKAGEELGKPTLSLLAYASPQAQSIQELSGQFTELSGIQLNWTILDEQSAATKASVALGSGGGYDIVHTTSNLMPTYGSRGWLTPLSELTAKRAVPGWDPRGFGQTMTSLLSFDKQLLAAPMFVGTQVFYYRKDIFDAAGIKDLPATFDDVVSVAAKVSTDKVKGIALRSAPAVSQLLFVWTAWLYAAGGKYYSSVSNGTYSGPALNSPAAVKALTQYCEVLQKYGPTGATNWSVEDAVRSFSSGQVAMIQEGAVFGGTFNDETKSQVAGKVGCFVIPKGPSGTFVPFAAHGWCVPKNAKATEAAGLFAQWATLKETLVAATATKTPFSTPPLADVYKSDAYSKRFGFDDYVPAVVKTIETANAGGVSPLQGDPNYTPAKPEWGQIGQKVAEQLSLAVTGPVSPAVAIEKAAALIV